MTVMRRILARVAQRSVSRALDRWVENAEVLKAARVEKERKQVVMRRVLARMVLRTTAQALHLWVEFVEEAAVARAEEQRNSSLLRPEHRRSVRPIAHHDGDLRGQSAIGTCGYQRLQVGTAARGKHRDLRQWHGATALTARRQTKCPVIGEHAPVLHHRDAVRLQLARHLVVVHAGLQPHPAGQRAHRQDFL